MCMSSPGFYVSAGIWTQVLKLVWQSASICWGLVIILWFNREFACSNAEGPCPQLVFDEAIKMPAAYGWAKGEGQGPLNLFGIGCRGEEREIWYEWGRKMGLRSCRRESQPAMFPNWALGSKGKQPLRWRWPRHCKINWHMCMRVFHSQIQRVHGRVAGSALLLGDHEAV